MFRCKNGDFPISTIYKNGLLVFGFSEDKKAKLFNNIALMEMLPHNKKTEVCFSCNLKDGRRFTAIADTNTYYEIHSIFMGKEEEAFNKSIQSNKKVANIVAFVIGIIVLISIYSFFSSTMNYKPALHVATGVSAEQEKNISNILTQCQVTNYLSITRDETLDEDGVIAYRVKFPIVNYQNQVEYPTAFLYLKNGQVYWVRYLEQYLYKDNQVVAKVSDF